MDPFLTIKRTEKNAGNCWIGRPTGVQEVAGSILVSGPIAFVAIWLGNKFYGHYLPTAESSRAVISYWWKYGHPVLVHVPVICNHCHHLRGWAGGIAGLMCGAVTFLVPPQCRASTGLVIFRKYTPVEFNIIKSSGGQGYDSQQVPVVQGF